MTAESGIAPASGMNSHSPIAGNLAKKSPVPGSWTAGGKFLILTLLFISTIRKKLLLKFTTRKK